MRLRRRALGILLPGLAAVACIASPQRPAPPPPGTPGELPEVRAAWLGLPTTGNGCPEHHDYFPRGGLAIFYCHAQSLLSLERLEQLAGMKATRPANPGAVAGAFRHYDPRFVEWLRGALLTARSDARFRDRTQSIYDRFVAPLARQYLTARRMMTGRGEWTDGEVRWVRERLERGTLPERWYADRYGLIRDDGHSRAAWDPNIGPTAMAFWIRRELDGSAKAFGDALEELVSTYDAPWLESGAWLLREPRGAARGEPSVSGGIGSLQPIANVYRDRQRLAGALVRVKGRVVKFDARIMGRNWIHLRDGSGSAQTRDHDLTVTTSDLASVGEEVTILGTASTDRDFGAGYAYPVILERARIFRAGPGTTEPPGNADALGGPGGAEIQDHVDVPEAAEGAAGEETTPPICGTIREQHPAPPYTFLLLASSQGEVWAAVPAFRIAPGTKVCVRDPVPMDEFRSTALRRTFPRVYFGRVE